MCILHRMEAGESKAMDQQNQQIWEAIGHFSHARYQAKWQTVWAHLTRKPVDLLDFEEVKRQLCLREKHYVGLQQIEIDKIVGSVGRPRDFTRSFLPRTDAVGSRWQRLDVMARGLMGFPPVEVIKVGDVYFVEDGNHRISVARQLGARTIEAYVTEMPSEFPLRADTRAGEVANMSQAACCCGG